MKCRPEYPSKPFDSVTEARAWVLQLVAGYNDEHLHSGIRYVTPSTRHAGHDAAILAARRRV
jgi:putative transposase